MVCILRFGIVFVLDFVLYELFFSFMFTIVLLLCAANKFCCRHFSTAGSKLCLIVFIQNNTNMEQNLQHRPTA